MKLVGAILKHWGKGYATEAAKAVLDYAFNELNLNEIISFTVTNNIRSRRVMEKIGLTYSGNDNFLHPNINEGSPLKRHVLYRLSKENYLTNKSLNNFLPMIRSMHLVLNGQLIA